MKQEYQIDLNPDDEELEPFEVEDENIARVRIQVPGPERKIISDPEYKIDFALSPEAMIGLGTELIRKGRKLQEGLIEPIQVFEQIIPITRHLMCQYAGIYLAPNSCELLIRARKFGNIHDVLGISDKEAK